MRRVVAPPARTTFPVTLTASTWQSLWEQAVKRCADRRGLITGTAYPKLTNREALQLVRAFSSARGRAQFPLWYQFAAVAYGWNPTGDTLDTSSSRADRAYPDSAELWEALHDLAVEADDDNSSNAASLYFDADPWGDALYASDVRRALQDDGADAQFKIPLPACKDPKTGKPVGRPHKNPKTGKWECDPVVIDDPVTHLNNQLTTIALLVAAAWLLFKSDKPRRRRRN